MPKPRTRFIRKKNPKGVLKPECEKCGYYNPKMGNHRYKCRTQRCPAYYYRTETVGLTPRAKRILTQKVDTALDDTMVNFPDFPERLFNEREVERSCISFLQVLTGYERRDIFGVMQKWLKRRLK